MKHTKIEKSVRVCHHTIFPEYCMSMISNSTDAFQVISIKEVFKEIPECLTDMYMHAHDFNLIIWTRNGRGTHYVDFEQYEIEGNELIFLSSRNIHYYQPANVQDGYVIAFSQEFLQHIDRTILNFVGYSLFSRSKGVNYCKVSPISDKQLLNLVELMMRECKSDVPDFLYRSCQASLLTLFLSTAIRECQWSNALEISDNSQSFKHYITFLASVEQNFTTIHSVKNYAERIGVSVCILSRCTQMYEGNTPLQIINERIILEAKRMLRYSSLRVKEVSRDLGFEDPSYFNKFFKKITGITPADFRELD